MSPVDPRLGGVVLGITDPQMAALATLRQEVADLRREVRDLRAAATIQVISGAPTQSSRDGTPVGDSASSKFWLRLAGQWKSVTLA
jgi:hypothetical protein